MKSNGRLLWTFLTIHFWIFSAFAQITPGQLSQYISNYKPISPDGIIDETGVKAFYSMLNYKTAWTQNENTANRILFFNDLAQSAGKGLREKDYQFNYIQSLRNNPARLQSNDDSLEAEIRITDAAIHYYSDMAYGNINPAFGYAGLDYNPRCRDIPATLADHILKNSLELLIPHLSSPLPEISALENKINWFQTLIADRNFKEAVITSGKVNEPNPALISKLYHLGILDSVNETLPNPIVKKKIKEAQRQFNLPDNGELDKAVVQELNVPISVRLQQLNLSVNYYRWLSCLIQNQPAIVVNIPAAYLKVYRSNEVILEMRIIAGKQSTPTPTLTSRVSEVVLYPYWYVPYSIATKELLPAIKRNTAFLDEGNYQVLSKAGKIVNPYSVNWQALSTKNFPYTIRQSTGCDNALGLLKLNFYNPFSVYLHDTPNKSLFKENRRFLSHGCIRMEKPTELGRLILKNNALKIDALEQKRSLKNQKPITVRADEDMPVMVWYNPVGIDSTGRVIFYQDIYGKFNWVKENK